MPADLCDEEGELICSQLDIERRQCVGMDFFFLSEFFSVGSTHERAVVATIIHVLRTPRNNKYNSRDNRIKTTDVWVIIAQITIER
jgi:hypothetical protein